MVPMLRTLALVAGAALLTATRVPGQQPWGLPVLAVGLLVALVCIPQGWRAQPRPWLPRLGALGLVAATVVPPAPRPLIGAVPPLAVAAAVFVLLLMAFPRRRVGAARARLPGPRTALVVAAMASVPVLWKGAGFLVPDRIASSYELQVLLGPLVAAPVLALALLTVGFLLRAVQAAFDGNPLPETPAVPAAPREVTDPAAAPA